MARNLDAVFRFPPPYSGSNFPQPNTAHTMSPQGILMPSRMQPPPMYGPRGATIPPKYFEDYGKKNMQQHQRGDYFCEPCSRGFQLQTQLDAHVAEHQQCGLDGCQFIGHSTIVSKHIEQQHVSGLYDKLKNLNTPEEIAKWREDRKKRYPTKSNIELRQQLHFEKMKRGERLCEKKTRFGCRDDRKKCRDQNSTSTLKNKRQRRRRRNRNQQRIDKGDEIKSVPKRDEVEGEEDHNGISRFRGTSFLSQYPRMKICQSEGNALTSLAGQYGSDSEMESDENDMNSEASPIQKSEEVSILSTLGSTDDSDSSSIYEIEPSLVNALPKGLISQNPVHMLPQDNNELFIAPSTENDLVLSELKPIETKWVLSQTGIESDQDEDDDIQEEVPFEKLVENLPMDEEENNGGSAPDEKLSRKRKRSLRKSNISITNKTRQKKTHGLNYSKMYRRRQNTMLEKLLQPDIVHERNVLLQCVRYVVQKNFFGIGQSFSSAKIS